MSSSTFRVTEPDASDSITLVMSPGGTVSPDKETVKSYLNSRSAVDINLLTMKQLESDNVTVILDSLTYLNSGEIEDAEGMDEIARNLVSFKMDHDYTPLTSPTRTPEPSDPGLEDSLVQTLTMLEDGSLNALKSPIIPLEQHEPLTKITKIVKGKKQSIFVTNKQKAKMISTGMLKEKPSETLFKRPKTIKSVHKVKNPYSETSLKFEKETTSDELLEDRLSANKKVERLEEEDEDYEEENIFDDEEPDIEDDTNDSDFEIENEIIKTKQLKSPKTRKKMFVEKQAKTTKPKTEEPEITKPVEVEQNKLQKDEKLEKKIIPKKEKKTPKPIPDDLALFSTPDIIRRVGNEKPTVEKPSCSKPAKISPDSRSKSSNLDQKTKRNSTDTKLTENNRRSSFDIKLHEKRLSTESKLLFSNKPHKIDDQVCVQEFSDTLSNSNESIAGDDQLEPLPSAEDIRAIIQNENTKSFTTSLVIPDTNDISANEQNFENVGLDLDQSILDNINSDLISDDILYQVAQSLVDNIDLQNAIDKSIVDGNLVLDPNVTQNVSDVSLVQDNMSTHSSLSQENVSSSSIEDNKSSGTQVVRSDGRVVVIPPIERPTTRSRNKKQIPSTPIKSKLVQRPLDEEHVSGNELDSESDGEEESEDDPNKLWCICNQPHNNRFMICCDTCEEWYHGKCVNVTKAMGHLMEAEGKEWICVFCKDSSLRRPKAAARRIRKASRTSTDSGSGIKKSNKESLVSSTTSVMEEKKTSISRCVVCSNPSRLSSIYCSDECILKHAQGVEKAVVFDRKNGKLLSGQDAPSSANLEKWLAENPTYEVVRSTEKQVNKHPPVMTQSKLKFVKNTDDNGVSLAVHKKGVNIGMIKHSPKDIPQQIKKVATSTPKKVFVSNLSGQSTIKTITPQKKTKVIQSSQITPDSNSPSRPKMIQTKLQLTPVTKENKELKDKLPQPQKTPKARRAEVSGQPRQDNLRETVRKTFFDQLSSRLKISEDLKLSEEELKEISNEIESQLYKCFGDTGQKYKNKYRSLIFNIKDAKNQTLWRRICEKSVNPYQLVRLSPDDLASQELALWREREAKHQLDMIKKSELELLSCSRQYVFKTHKGEQVFEDDRPKDQVTEVISGLGADSSTSLIKSIDDSISSTDTDKNLKHSRRNRSRDGSRERSRSSHEKIDRDRDRDSKERKKDKHSSRRDHHHHHKKSGSKDRSSRHDRKRSKSKDRHRRSSHKSSRHKKDEKTNTTEKLDKKSKEILEQLVDKHIVPPLEDRLWKHVQHEDIVPATAMESDSDHEPSSTVTIPTPPRCTEPDEITQYKTQAELAISTVDKDPSTTPPPPSLVAETVWKGIINMIDVAQISITAKEVSGDCHGLGEELPATLEIVGRISPETVWEYIGKMKSSNSKTISVLQLTATNMEEQMPYLALYSYLCSRNRLGVVKTVSRAVKDFYILPLAGHSPIPEQLLPITGPGFKESRPALLLGIIVRDKRRRPLDSLAIHISNPIKKMRLDALPPTKPSTPPSSSRSYTPPPTRDPRVKGSLVASTPSPTENSPEDDMDEPYSPKDSDPETPPEATNTRLNASDISNLLTGTVKSSSFLDSGISTQTFEPFSNKFETIPGLDNSPAMPSSSLELQRKMAELDQRIAAQKAEIDKVSKDLVSTASSEIGNSSLANISLPSNLQQILESIKTIGSKTDTMDIQGDSNSSVSNTSDLTIPLMLPKLSSRSNASINLDNTIPLNIPIKSKGKLVESEKSQSGGLLSSLSEEDLIKKAAEMLGEAEMTKKNKSSSVEAPYVPSKQPRFDLSQPPIPGLEDS